MLPPRYLSVSAILVAVLSSRAPLAVAVADADDPRQCLDTRCADHESLHVCLAEQPPGLLLPRHVEECYVAAGCLPREAARQARLASQRCPALLMPAPAPELRRRYRAIVERADETPPAAGATTPTTAAGDETSASASSPTSPDASSSTSPDASSSASPSPSSPASTPSKTGGSRSGTDCFTTTMIDTTSCQLQTDQGHVHTRTCSATRVASSDCAPGLLCTVDSNNGNICMVKVNALDAGGTVVAIIFGGLVAVGLGTLTFLCCRDRRQQKRFAKNAENALARAHTRKMQANEARAPLIRSASPIPSSNKNPFQDQAP